MKNFNSIEKNSSEEINKIDLKKAWEIAKEFGELLEENKVAFPYEFEDILPYDKGVILFSLLKIFKEADFEELAILNNTTPKMMKDNISTLIMYLDGFIPNPEEYKKRIELQKIINGKI